MSERGASDEAREERLVELLLGADPGLAAAREAAAAQPAQLTHSVVPSVKYSFFQIGTRCLVSSMDGRWAKDIDLKENASERELKCLGGSAFVPWSTSIIRGQRT